MSQYYLCSCIDTHTQDIFVCVLQCVAVYCSVLQSVAECFSALQYIAVCCSTVSSLPLYHVAHISL